MPLYEYRCENGHTFEVLQKMSDGPMTDCTVCGEAVRRVFAPPAIHFKGSGFYSTDYGKRKAAGDAASKEDGAASSDGGSDGKGDSKKAKESAPAASTPSSGSGSSSSD